MMKIELDTREIAAINAALELATVTFHSDSQLVETPSAERELKTRAIYVAQLRRKFDASKA